MGILGSSLCSGITGDTVQANPEIISYLALEARGSASGYSSDNDSDEPIQRWPIQRGSDEAGPSRPMRSCHAMCPIHCPLHPSSNLRRVQSYGGIQKFGEWHENSGGGLERPVRTLPILPAPESRLNYNFLQNPNANDKKGRRFPWFKKSWFKKPSWFKK